MTHHEEGVVLRAERITKRYLGVKALDQVSFDLRRGEIHALLGENGAGKSTLIKTISGSVRQDEGIISINGRQLGALTPTTAAAHGVGTVFQEMSLVPALSIAENIFLGHEQRRAGLLDKRRMLAGAKQALARIGVDLDPRTPVAGLSRAQMQLVEIARVLHRRSDILILDEPTASLSLGEARRLFEIITELRAQGIGIIYISHRLAEIKELADRVTVLRDGQKIGTIAAAGVTDDRLVEMMSGRTLEKLYPRIEPRPGKVRLRVSGLSGPLLRDVSFEVAAGEIVGLAGLVGSGKSEIGRACFGLEPLTGGTVEIDGRPLSKPSPKRAMRQGMIYYPADRHQEGLVTTGTLRDNITLPSIAAGTMSRFGVLNRREGAARTNRVVEALSIKPADPGRSILGFSGGNQQKALLARSFAKSFPVHVFDEPTVGIDIGAKSDVYEYLNSLCEQGAAVVLISSDTEEILGMSHRIYAVREGRIVADLRGDDLTEENVVRAFFGSRDASVTSGSVHRDQSA
ncbi:monosaccharide ABC transporter ATP-binding protein, CUT2 family [Micromonospora pattaloongensis]|uniref:Monosaccharide ABC transporter ATP-binding protein, CUT2 family n=1 Tax=Micromonospora pattaloongensis TaxID=405436 RepID=A0A1H3RTQ1_9ACTN|nr:sugar ABC transporter ATP-binding protein [Micromonospora pattaloongensis]SDZ29022.1 monosaccharide ABC transporter ATP-binding protein, CUT2 family [Micromonospora pattaloongensis]